MMEHQDPAALLDEARSALGQASRLILAARGQDLELAHGDLERAAKLLEAALGVLACSPETPDAAVPRALSGLRRQLQTALALHEHAGWFYSRWTQMLAGWCGAGYAPGHGQALPALFAPGRRVSLEA